LTSCIPVSFSRRTPFRGVSKWVTAGLDVLGGKPFTSPETSAGLTFKVESSGFLNRVRARPAHVGAPGRLKADSHIAYRAHAVPLPCRAAKGLECLFPHLIYTVRPCLIHTCHTAPMQCADHAVLLKATAQHGRRETACGLPARVRLLPATTRSSTKIVIRSIPVLLTTIHTYDCKEW
jgi:hypothetical protein